LPENTPTGLAPNNGKVLRPTNGRPRLADTVAALETRLESERTERKDERFLWLLVVVLLIDAIVCEHLSGFSSAFFLPISLLVPIAAGKMWGVPWIDVHLNRIFDRLLPHHDKDKIEPE
jgi:hypothetical protein